MNETDHRLTELENQVKDLHSLSGGLVKLLFLSLAYHTQNQSLTADQKDAIREQLLAFMDEPALEQIFTEEVIAEEVKDISRTMIFSGEAP